MARDGPVATQSAVVRAYEDLAVDFALQGNAERALFWVARSYAASPSGVDIRVLESPLFDRVRDDSDFSSWARRFSFCSSQDE